MCCSCENALAQSLDVQGLILQAHVHSVILEPIRLDQVENCNFGHIYSLRLGDDLAHVAAAGANASGACMLCVPGSYQTGSGQMQG